MALSLRLQTSPSQQEREEDKVGKASFASMQNKIQRTDHHLPGFTTHVASPPNRKARVSVRARCESATVSIYNFHNIHEAS